MNPNNIANECFKHYDDRQSLFRKRSLTTGHVGYDGPSKGKRQILRRCSETNEPATEMALLSKLKGDSSSSKHSSVQSLPPCQRSLNPLYLMNGINCSPMLPRRRNTGIPLTMFENDYIQLKKIRNGEVVKNNKDTTTTDGERNEKCRNDSDIKKGTEKLGKIYISKEFQSEKNRLMLLVSQYGNLKIQGRQLPKQWRSTIHVTTLSENGEKKKQVRKLERSTMTEIFKFNYAFYLPGVTLKEVQQKAAKIKLKTKKTLFSRKKIIAETEVRLDDVEVDPDVREEVLFHE